LNGRAGLISLLLREPGEGETAPPDIPHNSQHCAATAVGKKKKNLLCKSLNLDSQP